MSFQTRKIFVQIKNIFIYVIYVIYFLCVFEFAFKKKSNNCSQKNASHMQCSDIVILGVDPLVSFQI